MSCKKNPGADVAGCVTTLPLSGGSDHDAGATTFGTGRVRGRARVVESGRGRAPREGCGSGGDNVASAARARASAPRARYRRERKGVIGGKTLETGVTARAHLYALGEAEPALEVCVCGVLFLGRFQAHAEALRQGRVRGRVGTADGGRARRAFGCRVSLCTGVHERVAAPRGAPYRRSRHRGGHRGVEWEETEETNARDARGSQPRRVDARAVLSRCAPVPPVSFVTSRETCPKKLM